MENLQKMYKIDDAGNLYILQTRVIPVESKDLNSSSVQVASPLNTVVGNFCNNVVASTIPNTLAGNLSTSINSSPSNLASKVMIPLLPGASSSNTLGANSCNTMSTPLGSLAANRVILSHLPAPQSSINTSAVSNINTSIVSNMNTSGIASLNTTGIVPGGAPSVLPPATVILLPPPQLPGDAVQMPREPLTVQMSADCLPVTRDPAQIPAQIPLGGQIAMESPLGGQIALESFPVPRDPMQVPKESRNLPIEPVSLPSEPEDRPANNLNGEVKMDISRALFKQSLELNRLIIVVGEKNDTGMLETFIASGTSQDEKLLKMLEQGCKEQEEIRSLIEEQNKLVREHVQEQNEQMLHALQTLKQNQSQELMEIQSLQTQMFSMQEQLIQWDQEWERQQEQQILKFDSLNSILEN